MKSHCFAYIHATEAGGTHPALIEAIGRGALVLYRNTPENAEVAGDAGIPFESAELESKLNLVLTLRGPNAPNTAPARWTAPHRSGGPWPRSSPMPARAAPRHRRLGPVGYGRLWSRLRLIGNGPSSRRLGVTLP